MNKEFDIKNPWKQNTIEMEGNFKLAIKANDYLDNPNEETLNNFKEELKISSSLSMAAVLGYLEKLIQENKKVSECNLLLELIKPQFEPAESKTGVYDPMLGEIIYEDEENKKMNM
ncbi:MAG: hypothetical protein IJ105_05040 [Bacilli bacterium]|nr:hypothetical protein [Bacilli bacterium]